MTNFMDMSDLSLQQQMMVNQAVDNNKKDKTILIVLWLFFATIGVHRFYLGQTGYAVCLILFGWATLFIWPLVDIIFALKATDAHNEKLRKEAINEMRFMSGRHNNFEVVGEGEVKNATVIKTEEEQK